MRIGTWNLNGRWQPEHARVMADAACDVWLLTEVNERVELDGFHRHLSEGSVNIRRRWAGVYSRRPLTALPDPHVASAAATVDGITYCSTVLPWRGTEGDPAWPGETHAERTAHALAVLLPNLPTDGLVWGGDWNHALSGPEAAGSQGGRAHVRAAVEKLGLRVPTADLPHWVDGHLSIDHVAVGEDVVVTGAARLPVPGLSDHDCYVVDVSTPVVGSP